MKNQLKLCVVMMLFLFVNLSCNKKDEDVTMESIGLDIQKEQLLKGKIKINDYILTYQVQEILEMRYKAKVTIDRHELVAIIDYVSENIVLDGKDVILQKKEKQTFLNLGEQLSEYLFKDGSTEDFTMTEYTLLRLLEYWAKSPNNYEYRKHSVFTNRVGVKGSNEGITCIRKNTYVTAEYDDQSGRLFRDRQLVNGNRCLGRCGSGCPGIFTIASAWTKDCLDHDQCGRVLGGSTNPFDNNCGDEYGQAADDYLFGVLRGCRG